MLIKVILYSIFFPKRLKREVSSCLSWPSIAGLTMRSCPQIMEKNNSSLPFKAIVPSGNLPEPYIEITVFVLVSLSKLDSSNVATDLRQASQGPCDYLHLTVLHCQENMSCVSRGRLLSKQGAVGSLAGSFPQRWKFLFTSLPQMTPLDLPAYKREATSRSPWTFNS